MLSNFNKIVIIVSSVVLIISLLAYSMAIMSAQKNNYKFPPHISRCPDYWDTSYNSTLTTCKHREINPNKIDNFNDNVPLTIDNFNDNVTFTYNSADISNYNEAKLCQLADSAINNKIAWNGLTNNKQLLNNCSKY